MKKGLILVAVVGLYMGACSSMKKDTRTAQNNTSKVAILTGNWELDLIPYPKGTLDSLYPQRKPSLSFTPTTMTFTGYSGCNSINGPLLADNNSISFKGDIAMTMMACPGEGEAVFLENLKRINKYAVSTDGRELTLIQGDIALMHFHKK